ncbi:MAG TPA: hypothetical protein VFB14_02120 [Bryobacteraceae bacterium]|nr:hypothetical protein [Bryobacteraceae bacterium]
MAGEYDACASLAQFAQKLTQGSNSWNIQAVRWLIQQKIVWGVNDGAAESHFHTLALGKPGRSPICDGSQTKDGDETFDVVLQNVGV